MQNREAGLAAVGTLASAALAASHCLGVALFLVFGPTVGALSLLGALERYRPYFIAAGFAFWGFGFYRVYFRSATGTGDTPGTGGFGRALRRTRTLLWVGLAVLIFAVALPSLVLYFANA